MCHLLKERKKPGSVGKMHETDMHVGKYEITSGLIIGAQTGSQFKLTLTTSSVTSDNFRATCNATLQSTHSAC